MRVANRFSPSYGPFQQKYRKTQTHFLRAASKLSLHIRKSEAILPWPNTARPRSNRLIRKWLFAVFILAVSPSSIQRRSTAFYAGKALAKLISRFMSRKAHRLQYAQSLMSGFARWRLLTAKNLRTVVALLWRLRLLPETYRTLLIIGVSFMAYISH